MKPGLKQLIGYLMPYKMKILKVLVSLTFTAFSVLAIGYELRYIINSTGNIDQLSMAISLTLLFALVLSVATFLRASAVSNICELVISDLRRDLFYYLIHLSPFDIEKLGLGEISNRFTEECAVLNASLTYILSTFLRNSLMFIGSIIMLIYTSIKLSLFVLALIPAVVVPILLFGRRLKRITVEAGEEKVKLPEFLAESLGYIKTVQAYRAEEFEIGRFTQITDNIVRLNYRRVIIRSLLVASIIALVFMSIAIVIWIGEEEIIKGHISGGDLMSFIFYAILASSSLGSLSEIYTDIKKADISAQRIFALFDQPSSLKLENSVKRDLGQFEDLKLVGVEFAYSEDAVLRNINLDIKAGEKIAIIGLSGSGKSTLLQLLLRFYDVTKGMVLLNNVDIREIDLAYLRSYFSYVSQEAVIFHATIYDNICYGKREVPAEKLEGALRAAACEEFVSKLGINSMISTSNLSGGEKQRIAIARAFVHDAPILLMDEPTASLDYYHENIIQNSLEELLQGKTAIIIAHRLSTIKKVDKIIVLSEAGQIEAIGTHEELLANNSLYQQLIELQLSK